MSDDPCQRQISFIVGDSPGVRITAWEDGGNLRFTVDVNNASGTTADLRALFFDVADAKLPGLTVTGGAFLTESRIQSNSVIDLDDGANLSGKVKSAFDVGIEWGTPGNAKDNIDFEVGFTLSNAANNLTLDDIAFQRFGVKLDSIGGGAGKGGSSAKLLGVAPAAPDARDDSYSIFEDGAAGLNSPSKTPVGKTFQLLANDTDADPGAVLGITHVSGAQHGTVTVASDGKSVTYTPDADYSGADSFEYCISDGAGGQDSATVNVTVVAVADEPVITYSVSQGATINDMVVHVTARPNDSDGSETIGGILLNMPGGVLVDASISAAGPASVSGGVYQQDFVISTLAGVDHLFSPVFEATATEAANGDTELNGISVPVRIDYTHNQGSVDFTANDQSIWGNGNAFHFEYNQFHGIDQSFNAAAEWKFAGNEVASASFEAALRAGLQVDFEINGGSIDATIQSDITVNSTWNKLTDSLLLTSSAVLDGGSFVTESPTAHLYLALIMQAYAVVETDTFLTDATHWEVGVDKIWELVNLSSDDLHLDIPLGGVGNLALAWPNLSVVNDPGTLSGSGESNPFAELTVDVDALLSTVAPPLALLDTDPGSETNFELADLDLTASLRFAQKFALAIGHQDLNLVLEDGTTQVMALGGDLLIANASSHDANHDGVIAFTFDFAPRVTVNNQTDVVGDVNVEFTVVKNLSVDPPFVDPIDIDPLIHIDQTVFSARIGVIDRTFDLAGSGSSSMQFFA